MKFLRLFGSTSQRDAVLASIDYKILQKTEGVPGVGIMQGTYVVDYTIPFYIEDVSGSENTVQIKKRYSSAPALTIEKSTDGTTWETMGTTSTTAITSTIPANGKLYLRCNTTAWGYYDKSTDSTSYNYINTTGNCNVGGNIMSLLYGSNFTGNETTFPSDSIYAFYSLFNSNTHLVNASNLLLPATTLAKWCYTGMFYGCSSLTTSPVLPATTLAERCYNGMFNGCTTLTTAPVLPATTLAKSCYSHMFSGCTSLKTAPALPATTLAQECYNCMFVNCRSLKTAPALPVTTLASNCYNQMFGGCTSLKTAPALPATILDENCYASMFQGCTSLKTAPALPATTLVRYCYSGMFEGCTSLTSAPASLPATTLVDWCYASMFKDCTSLTTAPELPATILTAKCYRNMFNGCTNLNYIKCLATNRSASDCTTNWVQNVAANGTFVKDQNMSTSTWSTGINGIPSNWTVQDAA